MAVLGIMGKVRVPRRDIGDAMTDSTQDIQIVDTHRVPCDGGDKGMGHPRVWLQIPAGTGSVVCPYCDVKFVHRDASDAT